MSEGKPVPPFDETEDFRSRGLTGARIPGRIAPGFCRISSPQHFPMNLPSLPSITERSLAIIMGGGAGTRLFPLTKERSKPAVPLAGKYRIVDIPISNCINSGLRRIYVLTQFNSASLHRHINAAYKFDNFSRSFVEILAAQQTPTDTSWYQGTADAVRQNLRDFLQYPYDYYVILSGDQLYRMDYRDVLQQHVETKADMTLATIPVAREPATAFGIMHTDTQRRIVRFEEKPSDPKVLDEMRIPGELLTQLGRRPDEELFQASMGIYIFNRDVLADSLNNDFVDFGKHIIPDLIHKARVHSYIFQGYWEDIGTIRAFFDANIGLTDTVPAFNFFDTVAPIYTHARFLPGSKVNGATVRNSVISDGCIIDDAHIERSVIGIRSYIKPGTTIRDSVIMGADFYDVDHASRGGPELGIGRNCAIDHAIIDKNACIGDGAVISPDGKPENFDGPNYCIRDGIVVVPKGSVIPAGAWI
ncbi:MAG: glucose-phosphate adenylyltransferase [Chthoniobacter sp.]|jgi:glucose-1-phosphate adenylyltransferase|nr:glucose-phosphate adenylyltransferase [Chthoniobacter sp.]